MSARPSNSRADGSPLPHYSEVLRALRTAVGLSHEQWATQLVAAFPGPAHQYSCSRSTAQNWEYRKLVPGPDDEEAILALCQKKSLFRPFPHGPLAGIAVTEDFLRQVLRDARVSRSFPKAVPTEAATGTALPEHIRSTDEEVRNREHALPLSGEQVGTLSPGGKGGKLHRVPLLVGVVVILFILFIIISGVIRGLPATPASCDGESTRVPISTSPHGVSGTIDAPPNCAQTLKPGEPIAIHGSYRGDLADQELWLLVWAPDAKYYPQSADHCAGIPAQIRNGQWSTVANLGSSDPGQFDLVLTVAPAGGGASSIFTRWLQHGCSTKNYPGFSVLPPDVAEIASVTVRTGGK